MGPTRVLTALAAVLLGVAASEGYMRLLIEPDAFFEVSFSAGAQSPPERYALDEAYGFVFTRDFAGYMRHPDKVWGEPFTLDRFGFRQPERTPGNGPRERVAVVGGRSATMAYGLRDRHTIQRYMVAHASAPLEVAITGWAGFDAYRSWRYFQETLGRDAPFDTVYLAFNPARPEDLAGVFPADQGPVARHPKQDEFWDLMDGVVRMPKDELERRLGRAGVSSYVLYGTLKYRRQWGRILYKLKVLAGAPELSNPPVVPTTELDEEQRLGLARFHEHLVHVRDALEARGTQVVVLFIPSFGRPLDAYRLMEEAVPQGMRVLNLHAELVPTFRREDWIATIHYGSAQSEAIAARLVRDLEEHRE